MEPFAALKGSICEYNQPTHQQLHTFFINPNMNYTGMITTDF